MQMRCDQSCVWLLTPPAAPWCGDCKRTDAGVDRAAAKLQASVLRVDVGDRDSWRAPNHPLRLDPRVQLRCIPTLVQWFDDKAIARVGQPSFFFVGGRGGWWGFGAGEGLRDTCLLGSPQPCMEAATPALSAIPMPGPQSTSSACDSLPSPSHRIGAGKCRQRQRCGGRGRRFHAQGPGGVTAWSAPRSGISSTPTPAVPPRDIAAAPSTPSGLGIVPPLCLPFASISVTATLQEQQSSGPVSALGTGLLQGGGRRGNGSSDEGGESGRQCTARRTRCMPLDDKASTRRGWPAHSMHPPHTCHCRANCIVV